MRGSEPAGFGGSDAGSVDTGIEVEVDPDGPASGVVVLVPGTPGSGVPSVSEIATEAFRDPSEVEAVFSASRACNFASNALILLSALSGLP